MPSACPTVSLPQWQTAVVAQGPGKLDIRHNVPLPTLSPDMAIVRTAAVAINPADAKMLDYSAAVGATHGYDFAGTIVALGANALASGHLSVGDRVAGLVHGMNKLRPDIGAFAEYVGAYADLLLKIPDDMSFEDAASLGTGVATAALGLFHELRVPASLEDLRHSSGITKPPSMEDPESKFVLVAGGSTATGTHALQLLKLWVSPSPRVCEGVYVYVSADPALQSRTPPHRHLLDRQLRAGPPVWRGAGVRLCKPNMCGRHSCLYEQRAGVRA